MTASRVTKRDLIIDAAARCFYGRGIAATGVDTIASEAGVSKRTLYNHFPSKDDLVRAYIERVDERWRVTLDRRMASVEDPVDRVLAYFDGYFDAVDDGRLDEFRGCSLINAAAEMIDADDPVLALIQAQKRRVRDELATLVASAGIAEPADVADALSLLLEGAVAVYGVHRERRGVTVAKAAARRLLRTDEPATSP